MRAPSTATGAFGAATLRAGVADGDGVLDVVLLREGLVLVDGLRDGVIVILTDPVTVRPEEAEIDEVAVTVSPVVTDGVKLLLTDALAVMEADRLVLRDLDFDMDPVGETDAAWLTEDPAVAETVFVVLVVGLGVNVSSTHVGIA